MFKGGYQILDLEGTDFTVGTPVTVTGIHDKVSNMSDNIRKTIIVSDYKIDGNLRADSPVRFHKEAIDAGGFIINAVITSTKDPDADVLYHYIIEIDEADAVTFNKYKVNIVAV